jgi:Ni2+-binding GTPase involved in maturation of urease and hydrogenase
VFIIYLLSIYHARADLRCQAMADPTRNGVLVVSSAGCGKTALVEHLVDSSCFGEEFGCYRQDLNTSAGELVQIIAYPSPGANLTVIA